MKNKLDAYRNAGLKAVEFTLKFQQPDGGYIWEGFVKDAYHKQAYTWQLFGHFSEAQRLLNWVKKNTLQSDGQLKDFSGDIYKHSWFFQGAHKLGRFDLSYPVMSFILSCQAPCGGFPHFAGDELIRSLATAWTGVSALYYGNVEVAKKVAQCCISMLEQQPREDRFYFQMTQDGKLATEKDYPNAEFIDSTKPMQCYWEVGFPMILMCRMYQVTGDKSYLDYVSKFLDFKLRCREDGFAYWGSGKSTLGAALLYLFTGDEKAKEAAYRWCDFLVETQLPDGSWCYDDESDELLIHVDHAAGLNVWLQESVAVLESREAISSSKR